MGISVLFERVGFWVGLAIERHEDGSLYVMFAWEIPRLRIYREILWGFEPQA